MLPRSLFLIVCHVLLLLTVAYARRRSKQTAAGTVAKGALRAPDEETGKRGWRQAPASRLDVNDSCDIDRLSSSEAAAVFDQEYRGVQTKQGKARVSSAKTKRGRVGETARARGYLRPPTAGYFYIDILARAAARGRRPEGCGAGSYRQNGPFGPLPKLKFGRGDGRLAHRPAVAPSGWRETAVPMRGHRHHSRIGRANALTGRHARPPARHPGHQQASGEAFPACITIMHGRRIYSRGLSTTRPPRDDRQQRAQQVRRARRGVAKQAWRQAAAGDSRCRDCDSGRAT
eukprot:COSAG05_NODE_916_length_6616_cov_5.834433_3_plen_288_part_00